MSRQKCFYNFIFVAAFLLPINLQAELREAVTPLHAIGMGGAFTAVAIDDASIWTNPAGVARVRKARAKSGLHLLKIPNFAGASNPAGRSYAAALAAPASAPADVLSESNTSVDMPAYGEASIFPVGFFDIGKNAPMALGTLLSSKVSTYVDPATPTMAQVSSIVNTSAVITIGFASASNRANFGINFRPTNRYAYDASVPIADAKDKTAMRKNITSDAGKGTGVGIDAGAMFTLADFWFPTLGVSVLNLPTGCNTVTNPYTLTDQSVCGTKFSLAGNSFNQLSAIDPMDLRGGISISPRLSRTLSFRLAADVHHYYLKGGSNYYGLSGVDAGKLIHAGGEIFYGNPLESSPTWSLRAGVNQTFLTFGISARLGKLALDFASYGIDTSITVTPKEDRRTSAGVSLYF